MAVTTVFDGTLTASTPTAWVAVPLANLYTVQCTSNWNVGNIEYSVDGVNAFKLPTSQSPEVFRTLSTPIAWARVMSPGPSNLAGVKVTIANV